MKTVHNERLKLSATFLNGLAIAALAVGGVTPLVQALRTAEISPGEWRGTLIAATVCFGGAVVLHFIARMILGGLRE
ncbi:MAG: amino acid transporter [Rhodovulum sulfidophilum]|uniref:Amino acid transporter n=1 Tax=Rhodovulum sulfidophilum TaxID=35806 RepID=A0A2W5N9B0_RHOSU|nr:MAG: amino acid transporter [Rhodovulum sulfidophilum]